MTQKRDNRPKSELERQIDENLRRVYEEDATQELPEQLLALLNKLKEQE